MQLELPLSEESYQGSEGSSQSVDEMSQQELFKSLDQFIKAKEEMKVRIDSIAKLLPKLNERREFLAGDFNENQRIALQLSQQVAPLNGQIEVLQRGIPQKQEQKASLEKQIQQEQDRRKKIVDQISKLASTRANVEKTIHQKQDEISEINGQIKQIKSIQEYGQN
ncbi:MAG: hypothetical protein QG670_2892 [Thermoproteota archaeon]|nr:hypothetical protein [Thermoproteota archaeon]